jgi:hypothetical protein
MRVCPSVAPPSSSLNTRRFPPPPHGGFGFFGIKRSYNCISINTPVKKKSLIAHETGGGLASWAMRKPVELLEFRGLRVVAFRMYCGMAKENPRNTTSAYYMELGLRMKKKKHGQLLSDKDMFKRQQKHVNRRSNCHA